MTTLVLIGGKRTAQRISIRFPKREGQSRIRISFQAVERGGPFGSSAIFRGSRFSSTAERVVGGISSLNLERYQIHPLFFLARPLVKFLKEPASGFAKIFQFNNSFRVQNQDQIGTRRIPNDAKSTAQSRNLTARDGNA